MHAAHKTAAAGKHAGERAGLSRHGLAAGDDADDEHPGSAPAGVQSRPAQEVGVDGISVTVRASGHPGRWMRRVRPRSADLRSLEERGAPSGPTGRRPNCRTLPFAC